MLNFKWLYLRCFPVDSYSVKNSVLYIDTGTKNSKSEIVINVNKQKREFRLFRFLAIENQIELASLETMAAAYLTPYFRGQ